MDGPPASCPYPPACHEISRPESGKPDSGRRCPGLITKQTRIIQHLDRATPTRAVITDQEYSTRSGHRLPVSWRSSQAARLRQPTAWKSALRLAAEPGGLSDVWLEVKATLARVDGTIDDDDATRRLGDDL